jgi:hypothetical protein
MNIDTKPIANKLAALNRILPPYNVADPVEHLHRRWYGDNQSEDHKEVGDEWIHTRHKHVVSPYDER